jgi:hypothetical protein
MVCDRACNYWDVLRATFEESKLSWNEMKKLHILNWLTIALALSFAACARPVPPPQKTIETLYAPYLSHAAEHGESTWEKTPVYSKKFKAARDQPDWAKESVAEDLA